MYHIQLALDPSHLHIVEGTPTAKQAWKCIQKKFGGKRNDINESIMSDEEKPSKLEKYNPTVSKSHYENSLVDDEEVKEEKENKKEKNNYECES